MKEKDVENFLELSAVHIKCVQNTINYKFNAETRAKKQKSHPLWKEK